MSRAASPISTLRIGKFLAHAGVASRRHAEQLVREGRVTVNGERLSDLARRVDPARDRVQVDGRPVRPERPRYLAFHKPEAVLSTRADPRGRPTVFDLVRAEPERLYPVGRLDYRSTGLLLLTNDGELAQRLTHPRFGCEKVYRVKVEGDPSEAALERLRRGVVLDRKRTRPCKIRRLGTGRHTWLEIALREGRNQQIRRMFLYARHPVLKLQRIRIGPLELGKLAPGALRELTRREVLALQQAAGAEAPPSGSNPRKPGLA
ncbi:MAG TPA: pseudouridine synthase [Acidobacteriota bacterium]